MVLAESKTLTRDSLDAQQQRDAHPEEVVIMTDRYTNAEWATQIAETQKKIFGQAGEAGWKGNGKKYELEGGVRVGSQELGHLLARSVDHTVLKLDATAAQIDALCSEARTEGFKSVCVRLHWVSRCVTNLKGSPVVVACVVGFHEGTHNTYDKLHEASAAVAAGAAELDVVLNHSILTQYSKTPTPTSSPPPPSASASAGHKRDSTADTITWQNTNANTKPATGNPPPSTGPYSVSGSSTTSGTEDEIPDYSYLYRELASIRSLCPSPTVLKLIFETSRLSPSQIVAASHLAAAANFDFIKTSTGFDGPGATLPNVELMVAAAEHLSTKTKSNGGSPVRGRKMQVKASGGIRGLDDAVNYLEAGATRLGTSSGVWIMQEARKKAEGSTRPEATRLYTDDSEGY